MKKDLKFVGLHNHSTIGSPFDALGFPNEAMDFAYENGMQALALTDHGNCNGVSYQILHAEKMKKEGKKFKPIYGVEAYFHPDLNEWRELYEKYQLSKTQKKTPTDGMEDVSGAVKEDEAETKTKAKDPLKKRNHLVLLAQNQTGLNNIFSLVSESFEADNFYKFPRIDFKMLKKYNEGILVSSACLGGVFAGCMWDNYGDEQAILDSMRSLGSKFKRIFDKRFFGELQWLASEDQMRLNAYIIQVCDELGLEVISTCDSHYPRPELWKDRALYKKINPNFIAKELENGSQLPKNVDEVGYELYPKNGSQMWDSYRKYSEYTPKGIVFNDEVILESIERTHDIAFNRIDDFIPDRTVKLPSFIVPEGKTAPEALRDKAYFKLAQKGIDDGETYETLKKQLDYELDVIAKQGFSEYFLMMDEISDRAQKVMLTGSGRGSAAGALLSYVLGITQVNPLKWGLMFSRFMRKDQKDYPDIDFDVSRNDLLKDMLVEEWGNDKVVPISNWNTLQPKTLIKDVSRFYGISHAEVNSVTTVMEKEAKNPKKKELGIKFGIVSLDFDDLKKHSPTLQDFLQRYPAVASHLNTLYGQVKSCSRHAGGVVISEGLKRRMPLIRSGQTTQTPWSEGQNVRHLEPLGFIKFDILGLTTLAMIEDAIKLILKKQGNKNPTFDQVKEYYNQNLHPDVLNFEDQEVYENTFHKGNFAGVFQFAEEGMRNFAIEAKPRSLIDITALSSIYRPGPLEAEVDRFYVEAKRNPAKVKYIHPVVEKYTKETYGFCIFQEQIAQIAVALGKDITEDEGNLLRKVLTKKGTGKGHEVKDAIYEKFIAGCLEKDLSKEQADEQWKIFINFAGYGFNKSHALCYSVTSFQCAWLLHYHPAEWLCAYLNNQHDSKRDKAMAEVKTLGFEIQEPDIQTSTLSWEPTPDGKTLIQPLNSINGLGEKAMLALVANRPYNCVEDLMFGDKKANKKTMDALIRAGAASSLMDDRFRSWKHFWLATTFHKPPTLKKFLQNIEEYKSEPEFTQQEIVDNKYTLTGAYPFNLVVSPKVQNRIDALKVIPISDHEPDGETRWVWFIPTKIVSKMTANKKKYWIIECIDLNSKQTSIKVWNVAPDDKVYLNRPYAANLDKGGGLKFQERWGFSTTNLKHTFRLIG